MIGRDRESWQGGVWAAMKNRSRSEDHDCDDKGCDERHAGSHYHTRHVQSPYLHEIHSIDILVACLCTCTCTCNNVRVV